MKKVLIGVGIFILLLVVAVVALPFLFKDKINARVKEEINQQVNARVDYGDFSLSLLRSFPNFSFSIDDVSVVGVDSFKGDTLAYIKNFNFTVDIMTVIKGGKYKLLALNLSEPHINALVNYEGKANWDIMKPSKENKPSEPMNFSLEIKKYKIDNGHITYDDKKGNMFAEITGLNFEGSGDVTENLYDFVTKTNIAELTYRSGAVPYLSKAKLDAEVNLRVDNANSKYTFKENSINLNDLGLQFDGYVQMNKKDETNLDVQFKSKKTEFKSILSLIPAVYKKDFDKVKTSGSLALEGSAKGVYKGEDYPSFNLKLQVNNGMFQYPSLPVAVKNIFINSTVTKPQGSLDLMTIDIPKLHLEAGSDPVDARIKVRTPVSDPNVDAFVAGRMNLANVPNFYPMEGLKTLSGLLVMNLDFSGRKSDIDKKNYSAIKAAGNAKITNLVYDSKETPMPVRVSDMQMTFNPQNVTLSSFSAAIGRSDFNATGTLDNFMAYSFGKGDLVGMLNLRSAQFDANEWLQKDVAGKTQTPKATDTSKSEYFKVPAHIDFTANSQIGKIYYEKMVLENVKGQITVRNEAINLNDLFANIFGGSATITAHYTTKGLDHPDISFVYDIKNFDFQKTYQGVGMAEKLAPVIKYVQGNFSSDLKGEGKLTKDMNVDYASLNGDGKVEIPSAKIVGLPILTKITEATKIPALQNLELKNGWTVIKFHNGRVNVEPTDLKFGNGYNVNVQGSNGFDQSIDYDMRLDVPSKELGPATAMAQSYLSKIPGVGLSMPESVGFVLKVTGTTAKPQVKLSKVLAGGNSVKDIAKAKIDDLKKQAEAEAKKQAAELKQKAEAELQKQKEAAQKQAQEAIDKAKKEAAERAKKEAEKSLKNVFKFPH